MPAKGSNERDAAGNPAALFVSASEGLGTVVRKIVP